MENQETVLETQEPTTNAEADLIKELDGWFQQNPLDDMEEPAAQGNASNDVQHVQKSNEPTKAQELQNPQPSKEPEDNPKQLLELTRKEREIDNLRKEIAALKAKPKQEDDEQEVFTKQQLIEAFLDGDTKLFEKLGMDPVDVFDRLTHVITGGALKPEHVNTARIKKLEMRFDAEQRALMEATRKAEAQRKHIEEQAELENLLNGYRSMAAKLAEDENTYEFVSAYDKAEIAQSAADISLEYAKKNNGTLLTPKQALDVLEKRLKAVYEPVNTKLSKKNAISNNRTRSVTTGDVDDTKVENLSVHSLSKRTAENASKHITDAEVEASVIREVDNQLRALFERID